jgi:hypothetical protein
MFPLVWGVVRKVDSFNPTLFVGVEQIISWVHGTANDQRVEV